MHDHDVKNPINGSRFSKDDWRKMNKAFMDFFYGRGKKKENR